MSYSVSIKDGRKVVKGSYVPSGYTCKCKECTYTIEVLADTTDDVIANLVKMIEG
jgi:predicted nucleic acid-binding Zn ribbon protein